LEISLSKVPSYFFIAKVKERHSDVDAWKKNYTYYRISKANIQRMKTLKQSYNFRSYDALISFLINSLAANGYPAATPQLFMENAVPIVLTGVPGSGKTTFLRNLIPRLEGPIFVLDVHDEYPGLHKINLGEFFALDFKREKRKIRLVPSTNVDVSKSEADSVFRHLIMFQKELSGWIIVVEEGHRFTESPFLKSLMAEGRKHTRKTVVVSRQVEHYEGLGIVLKVHTGLEHSGRVSPKGA